MYGDLETMRDAKFPKGFFDPSDVIRTRWEIRDQRQYRVLVLACKYKPRTRPRVKAALH